MDPSAIALQGLQQAEVQVETAASAVAGAGAASANGSNPDVVDISAEMLALISAQAQVAVNAESLATVEEVEQTLLNVTA
jgi:flagellar hook protein FlgE